MAKQMARAAKRKIGRILCSILKKGPEDPFNRMLTPTLVGS